MAYALDSGVCNKHGQKHKSLVFVRYTADNMCQSVCRMEGTEVKQLTVQPTTTGGRGMFLNILGKRRGEPDQKVNVKIDSAEIEVLKALLQVWLAGFTADAWCLPQPGATVQSGVMAAVLPALCQFCNLHCCRCGGPAAAHMPRLSPCSCPVQFAIPRLAGFDEYFAREDSVSGGDFGLTQNTGSGSDAWRGMPTERPPY